MRRKGSHSRRGRRPGRGGSPRRAAARCQGDEGGGLLEVAALALAPAGLALHAYPLDGYAETGIRRLEGSRLAQEGQVKDVKQPPGALLGLAAVEQRLVGQTRDLPAPDPEFTRRVCAVLTGSMEDYGLAVLDLSDPARPRYAEHRADHRQNVGSVGKVVVALALFDKTFAEPIKRNGLDLQQLRQGSFFTAGGKARVPGNGERYGTARELARYLLFMEQGRLADLFSSREIKRLIYVTEHRIRYASSPALADAAVYFKSGRSSSAHTRKASSASPTPATSRTT